MRGQGAPWQVEQSNCGLLSRNLSTLSTSALRDEFLREPSASARGTCDRVIWAKALAFAADAGSYGF
jgi:hypothetical protein